MSASPSGLLVLRKLNGDGSRFTFCINMENGDFISLNLRHGWLLLLGIVDHRKRTVYEDNFKELEAIAMKDERLLDAFTQWQELSLSDEQYFAYEGRLSKQNFVKKKRFIIAVKLLLKFYG
jgi:hypothetical protein